MIIRGSSRPDILREEVLADLFEATAARQPDHAALIFGDIRISYGELDERASLMAHHLIGRGVRPGHIVGLWLPRGIDLLVDGTNVYVHAPGEPPAPTRLPDDFVARVRVPEKPAEPQ